LGADVFSAPATGQPRLYIRMPVAVISYFTF
jgi:hypothetical protein